MDVLQPIIPRVEPQSCRRHIWQFVVGLRPSRFPVVCVSQFLHDDSDCLYVSLSNLSTWQDQSHISVTQTVYGSDDKIAFLSTKSIIITNLTGYPSWMGVGPPERNPIRTNPIRTNSHWNEFPVDRNPNRANPTRTKSQKVVKLVNGYSREWLQLWSYLVPFSRYWRTTYSLKNSLFFHLTLVWRPHSGNPSELTFYCTLKIAWSYTFNCFLTMHTRAMDGQTDWR